MTHWLNTAKRWSLATVASATFLIGVFALTSCGGSGGPVGDGHNPPGDNPDKKAFLALMKGTPQETATFVGNAKCGDCHNDVHDEWSQTKHSTLKVECENCHGPGSAHVAAPGPTTILGIPRVTSPVVCGQCHGPLKQDWSGSAHAQITEAVEETVGNPAGFGRSSMCIKCHSGLMKIEVEEGKDLSTMSDDEIIQIADETLNEYPYTASCATCHDPHAKTGNLTWKGEDVQLRHPEKNMDPTPVLPGALPAQTTSFDQICAQCHNGRGANPSDAVLLVSTSRPNMHDSNQYNMLMGFAGVDPQGGSTLHETTHSSIPGQCSHCHMPNSRHTYTVSFDTSCQPCHTSTDAADRANRAKSEVSNALFKVLNRLQKWANKTVGDPNGWDYSALVVPPPDQTKIPIEIRRARHNYYFVVRDSSFGVHNLAYTRLLLQVANANLDLAGAPQAATANMATNDIIKILKGDPQLHRACEMSLH